MPIDVMVATTVQRSKIEVRDIFIGTNMTARCGVINALIESKPARINWRVSRPGPESDFIAVRWRFIQPVSPGTKTTDAAMSR
jgi:hypothetical protein